MKTALVAGGTGLTGKALLDQLANDPHYGTVHVLVRKESQGLERAHPKLRTLRVDFETLVAGTQALPPADEAFCCLGTTIKQAGSREAFARVDAGYVLAFVRAAQKSGVQYVAVISALGANKYAGNFYSRVKGQVEEELIALRLPRLHILRPSLLLGDREEKRPGEAWSIRLVQCLRPLLLGPMARLRPVAVEDVARTMRWGATAVPPVPVRITPSEQIGRSVPGR